MTSYIIFIDYSGCRLDSRVAAWEIESPGSSYDRYRQRSHSIFWLQTSRRSNQIQITKDWKRTSSRQVAGHSKFPRLDLHARVVFFLISGGVFHDLKGWSGYDLLQVSHGRVQMVWYSDQSRELYHEGRTTPLHQFPSVCPSDPTGQLLPRSSFLIFSLSTQASVLLAWPVAWDDYARY